MQYNDNGGRQGLVQDTLFNCGLTPVSASFTQYALADITRNINQSYLQTCHLIWQSANGWQWDDSNKTDLPIATTNLVNNQQDYSLPTIFWRIQRISVKDSNGTYQLLKQTDPMSMPIDLTQFQNQPGMPLYYDLVGQSIMLYPTPVSGAGGATMTSGMKVIFDREPTMFTSASTTASPGFASPFHKILSYSAAIDFVRDTGEQDRLVAMKSRLENSLVNFYSKRNIDGPVQVKPFMKRFKNTYR